LLKPTSIRVMNLIVYLKLVMMIVFVAPQLFFSELPKEVNLPLNYTYFAVSIISLVTMIVFIRKKKHWPTLFGALAVLISSFGLLHFMLSIVIILLFFLKSTRNYFRGINKIDPKLNAAQPEEVQEGEEGEAHALSKPQHQSKTKKDPEVYIREATPDDADTIHTLMYIAFEEYKTAIPPSSALEETSDSILESFRNQGESAAILYEDDTAVAMVRFKYIDETIYFFRLSVIPPKRRRGYARQLVKWIEKQGVTKGMNISRCRVRQSVQNNLVLYQNMGYEIVDQELIVRPAGTVKALTMEKKLGLS
jgi:ribosomal protein S18 acetylase RimI-like enzyme